ncbi:unnamed protein product [Linum trigynum]|uniref:Uncharacterized protein n=1 Tax=Linum trigynum TaxID=586398 RepID=A0AAV2GZP2_9ROSI
MLIATIRSIAGPADARPQSVPIVPAPTLNFPADLSVTGVAESEKQSAAAVAKSSGSLGAAEERSEEKQSEKVGESLYRMCVKVHSRGEPEPRSPAATGDWTPSPTSKSTMWTVSASAGIDSTMAELAAK